MNKSIVGIFNVLARTTVATTLAVVGSTVLLHPAVAKPDPTFNPILSQLKQELPSNWTVRLPSKLNFFDYNRKKMVVHPNLNWGRKEVVITFSSTPRCQALACLIGANITIYPSGSKASYPSGDRITLQSGVYGSYSGNCFEPYDPRVGSRGRVHRVYWQQDKMIYSITNSCPSLERDKNELAKKDLIEMAISISKENPI
jgi:hypothetical protein